MKIFLLRATATFQGVMATLWLWAAPGTFLRLLGGGPVKKNVLHLLGQAENALLKKQLANLELKAENQRLLAQIAELQGEARGSFGHRKLKTVQ